MLHRDGRDHDLGAVGDMPLSFSGAARYNLANLAGAALLASMLGVPADIIAAGLERFGANREDNPGRLERWQVGGATVLLDYAHNPEGLAGLLAVAAQLREAGRRTAWACCWARLAIATTRRSRNWRPWPRARGPTGSC